MPPKCPHCQTDVSFKTRFQLFKDVKKGGITPRRRCPVCKKWMVKKTPYVIVYKVIILIAMIVTMLLRIKFFILVLFLLVTLFLFNFYVPYQKYNEKVFNVDNKRVEGQSNEKV